MLKVKLLFFSIPPVKFQGLSQIYSALFMEKRIKQSVLQYLFVLQRLFTAPLRSAQKRSHDHF